MFCVARRPIRFLAEFSRNVQSFRDKLVKEANEKHNVPLDVPLSPPPPGHPHRTMYPDLPAVQEETDSTTGSYFSKSNDSLKKTLKIDLIPPKIEITTNHPDPSRTPTESMYHTMGSEAKISSPFAVAEELNGSEAVDFNPFAAQSSRNVSLKKVPASNPMITSSPSIAAKPSTLENATPLSTFRDSPPDHQQKTKMSSSGINALPWSFESLFRTPQLTTPASSGTGVSNFSPFLSEAFPRTPSKPQTSSKNELQRGKDESSTTQYKECADCNVRHYSEKAWERHLDLRHPQGRKKETSWMTAKTMKTAQEQGTVRLDSDYAVLTSTCSLSAPPEELSEDSLSCISVVCISGTAMRQDEFPSESVARLPLVATEDTMDALICVSCENPPMGETNHDLIHVRCSHNGVETTLGATWRESLREGAHVCVVGQLRMNPQMDAVSSKYYYYPMIYVSPVCGSVTVLG